MAGRAPGGAAVTLRSPQRPQGAFPDGFEDYNHGIRFALRAKRRVRITAVEFFELPGRRSPGHGEVDVAIYATPDPAGGASWRLDLGAQSLSGCAFTVDVSGADLTLGPGDQLGLLVVHVHYNGICKYRMEGPADVAYEDGCVAVLPGQPSGEVKRAEDIVARTPQRPVSLCGGITYVEIGPVLSFAGRPLDALPGPTPLAELGIGAESTVDIPGPPPPLTGEESGALMVLLRCAGGETRAVTFEPDATLADLRAAAGC